MSLTYHSGGDGLPTTIIGISVPFFSNIQKGERFLDNVSKGVFQLGKRVETNYINDDKGSTIRYNWFE